MTQTNRSKRLRVYLTPEEYQQLNQRADEQNQRISTYARTLLLSPLAADFIGGRSQEEQCQALELRIGELYGLLDVLISDLLAHRHPEETPSPTHPTLVPATPSPETQLKRLENQLSDSKDAMDEVRRWLMKLR